jgi:hypothetical protein
MTCQTKLVRKRTKENQVVSYTCDCCKKIIPVNDWIEMQEMLRWRMTGGFGSVFGDGAKISLDLCQACTKRLLGEFIQVSYDELD